MSDLKRTRLLALIGPSEEHASAASAGVDALDAARRLPGADVLLLVAGGDPDAMVFRYTAFGELGGDSWHPTVADAQEQAGDEYGDALLPWEEVPDEVADAHAYAIAYASDRLNDRGKW
jgi:hypothetical protein